MLWFKHRTNMRHDIKLKRVINRYGLEGYGLYNLIVESIVESLETDNPLPILRDSVDDIAMFYNANSAKVEEMVYFMVNQGLFDFTDDKSVVCIKVYKHIQASQTRNEQIRCMIKNFSENKKTMLSQTVSDNCELTDRQTGQDITDGQTESVTTPPGQSSYPQAGVSTHSRDQQLPTVEGIKTQLKDLPFRATMSKSQAARIASEFSIAGLPVDFVKFLGSEILNRESVKNPGGLLWEIVTNLGQYDDLVERFRTWSPSKVAVQQPRICPECGHEFIRWSVSRAECEACGVFDWNTELNIWES